MKEYLLIGGLAVVMICVAIVTSDGISSHQVPIDTATKQSDTPRIIEPDGIESLPTESSRELPSSVIRILAHPDRYHGKKVTVDGFLRAEFEGNAIYLSKEDDQHMMLCNAIWVSFDDNAMKMSYADLAKEYSEKYVHLEGTFDKDHNGHLGAYQGTIKNITRLYVKRDRSN